MDGEYLKKNDGSPAKGSLLLELAASDGLLDFKREVEEKGCDIDGAGLWYGRRIGSKKMGFEERTPLMIASLFGSIRVLKYMLGTGRIDVSQACGSDKVTALHCAVAGGSGSSVEAVKLLLDASADVNCVDGNGNKPIDVIASSFKSNCYSSRRKAVELLLGGHRSLDGEAVDSSSESDAEEKVASKKEYPVDISLPDINNAIFSTDEFRMYTFKVKPCSRAYSHDWTECPFVHPGENARRRDPRKYPYTCVPCPEFRKGGSCPKGDSCEYAHGVFESWLHPAQYRTRLCKDETGCSRKVCFFAHRPEELRPVYASTGSALPSPKSYSAGALDMGSIPAISLGLPAATSTPPMSPLAGASPSPKSANLWQNKVKLTPPTLQLPGSRLKTALSARDLGLEMELMEEIPRLSSPSHFALSGDLKPTNLDDIFGSIDSPMLSQLQGMSLKQSTPTQLQSPTGLQIRRSSYPSNNLPSSPVRKHSPPFGFDSSSAVATAVMNSRSAAMTKRSQSFIDRGAMTQNSIPAPIKPSNFSDWASPNGKLDWGVHGDELNKLRKSASFGFRSNSNTAASMGPAALDEPDVSWVNTLVKDVPPANAGVWGAESQQYINRGKGAREMFSPWGEQLYIEPEQMVA
ncbi:zinc finger CCCH domain-containing protein 29 [Punica granatum]|uniref:C3H1-type domain-containing protein n=2 Tax=Punica granatum TaxID=22663 RepID=A0A218WBW2_PUNGR|nr:zinc finger CCCH domain-containing protein 29 [Punica granatum]OWM69948.1 hypothetical protein CDL15_Pgr025797 [Punica granatum]PKI39551.1 hypothetical protein CRG98_040021 [Punica granatum]